MLLTLYKDTILNDRYSTVFDCDEAYWGGPSNTPLMKYLSLQFKKYFDLPTIYMQESGTITVDIALPQTYDIFEYNYMSLENDEFGKRYYFIDNIELGNGIVQLSYTLDVWHTYSSKMRLNHGILGRARRNVENLKRALPVAYETSEPFQFSRIGTNEKFYLVAEINEYIVSSAANDATVRRNFTAFVGWQPTYGETKTEAEYDDAIVPLNAYASSKQKRLFTMEEAQHVIHMITRYQGVKPQEKNATYRDILSSNISVTKYLIFDTFLIYSQEFRTPNDRPKASEMRYDINQIFAIPQSMFNDEYINTTANQPLELGLKILTSNNINADVDTKRDYEFEDIAFYNFTEDFNGVYLQDITLDANALTVGYGLRNMLIPLPYNGLDYTIQTIAQINDLGFSIGFLTPEEGYIDLNPMFEVPLPFTTPSGVERQQQAIAKEQAKIQRATTIAAMVAPIGFSAVKGVALSGAGSTFAAGWQTMTSKTPMPLVDPSGAFIRNLSRPEMIKAGLGEWATGLGMLGSGAAKGAGRVLADPRTMMSGIYGTQAIINAQNQLKSPVNAGGATNTTPNALSNAAHGFGIYTITPNNSVEMNDAIDKIGYTIYLPINDYHHGIEKADARANEYDIVQFLNVEVTGAFSQTIARVLEGILMAGFRIIYDT